MLSVGECFLPNPHALDNIIHEPASHGLPSCTVYLSGNEISYLIRTNAMNTLALLYAYAIPARANDASTRRIDNNEGLRWRDDDCDECVGDGCASKW